MATKIAAKHLLETIRKSAPQLSKEGSTYIQVFTALSHPPVANRFAHLPSGLVQGAHETALHPI